MLRACLLALIVTLSACATAQAPVGIRVTGAGSSFEDAKNNAFKIAIEQAVGTVLVAEVEVINGKLARDEIINHSSGYVDRYQVLSRSSGPGSVIVDMNVWVNSSKIANRILGKSRDAGNFDGPTHSTQYSTYVGQQRTGDEILHTVLRDHPRRAYNIVGGAPTVRVDYNRNAVIRIPYKMTWNQHYMISLQSALDTVGLKPQIKTFGQYVSGVYQANRSGRVVNGDNSSYELYANPDSAGTVHIGPTRHHGQQYYIADRIQLRALMTAFSDDNAPVVRVTLRNHANAIVYDECLYPGVALYSGSIHGSNRLTLIIDERAGNFEIVTPNSALIESVLRTEMSIQSRSTCKR